MLGNKELWKGFTGGVLITAIVGISVFSFQKIDIPNENVAVSKEVTSTALAVVSDKKVESKLENIAKLIDTSYYKEIEKDELETYLYKGLIAGLGDPYSAYYSKDELQKVIDSTNGTYYGVGITMAEDTNTGMVKIIKVSENSPAQKSGVQVGDYIYKVDDEDITDMDLSTIASKVRGEEGTTVKVTLVRENESEPLEKEIERKNIESITVKSEMLEDHIGYIMIGEFEKITTSQFEKAYNQLVEEGMQGLIVDLRDNPGGQVDVVNQIGEAFLPKGVMTYIEDKYGNRQDYPCKGTHTFNKALVVLLNGNSASASEIFAGAVKDYKIGTLVGTTTYGKGIVQMTKSLGDGTAVKLTFAKYYTPNGSNIHGKGIEPDIVVELNKDIIMQQGYSKEVDNQLQTAIQCVKDKMK